jgi:hypothetical protein
LLIRVEDAGMPGACPCAVDERNLGFEARFMLRQKK